MIDLYVNWCRKTKFAKDAARIKRRLAPVRAGLGAKTFAELTPFVLNGYIANRRPVKPISVLRELNMLASAAKFCVENKLAGGGCRFALPKIKMNPPRPHFLTVEQGNALLDYFKQKIGNPCAFKFTRLALATGQRLEAICDLTWDRVDFNAKLIFFADPELPATNKKRAVAPMTANLFAEMTMWRLKAPHDLRVVPHPPATIQDWFRRASKQLGFRVTPHMLRHTAITWMLQAGVDPVQISRLVKLSVQQILNTYGHYRPGWLTPSAETLESVLNSQRSSAYAMA